MKLFEPNRANQLFCCPQHLTAWNNRATARGRVLTPIAMAAYITRHGSRGSEAERAAGRKATGHQHALIQRWRDEDRAAGRMTWPEYTVHRYRLGFDPL